MINIPCSFVTAAQKETKYIELITYTFSNTQLINMYYSQFGISNSFYVFLIQINLCLLQVNAEQDDEDAIQRIHEIHEYMILKKYIITWNTWIHKIHWFLKITLSHGIHEYKKNKFFTFYYTCYKSIAQIWVKLYFNDTILIWNTIVLQIK